MYIWAYYNLTLYIFFYLLTYPHIKLFFGKEFKTFYWSIVFYYIEELPLLI